jgi:uncharacterized protein DUF5681
MGRVENLKPWQPGQSGNPGGRPKKKPITELYEQLLSDRATLNAIRTAILRNIKSHKTALVPLLREMADRVEGKVTQPIDATVSDFSHWTDEEIQSELKRVKDELFAAENEGPAA